LKSSDGLFKEIKTSLLGLNDQQILAHFEAFMKHGQVFPPSTPVTYVVISSTTGPESSTAIISPIPSLTPLATNFETPSSEVIHIDELTPILPE
jgi:hypothetical protein